VIVQRRNEQDIWRNLYEFPMIELPELVHTEDTFSKSLLWEQVIGSQSYIIDSVSAPFRQLLTHQKIIATFWEIQIPEAPKISDSHLIIERKNLRKFAFPKIIDLYLRDNSLYLKLL
jgi:A/G-specific adenine glycosylase